MKGRILCFLIIGFWIEGLFSQTSTNLPFSFEDITQYFTDLNLAEDEDQAYLMDRLGYFYENPIVLNRATREDLEGLGLLNQKQVNAILQLRNQTGSIQSIYELQVLNEIDARTFNLVKWFLSVNKDAQLGKIQKVNHFLLMRSSRVLERAKGYISENDKKLYVGDRESFYLRYLCTHSEQVKFGFTVEKDPGEKWLNLNNGEGFDYTSGFILLQDHQKKYQVILGDYHLKFGQGLVTWTGGGVYGLGIEGVKKKGLGMLPYTSTNENEFFRGAGMVYKINRFSFTAFASGLSKDANLIAVNGEGTLGFSSLKTSGRHHTISEIEDKDVLREKNIGGAIVYHANNLIFGTCQRFLHYNLNDVTTSRTAGQNQNLTGSLFYDGFYKNFNFFGELGYNWLNNSWASVSGVLVSLDPKLSLVVKSVLIHRDFFSVYGGTVKQTSKKGREENFLIGLELNPMKSISLLGSVELNDKVQDFSTLEVPEKKAWFQFGIDNKKVACYLRYTAKTDNLILGNNQELGDLKSNYRFNLDVPVTDRISLKSRIELCFITNETRKKETGNLILQDVKYKTAGTSIILRYALFNSDSYQSGIYAYENDLTYVFYTPKYYNVGKRISLVINQKINRSISLALKLARWSYEGQETIGSGGDLIQKNCKTELKFQLKIKI